MPRCVVMLACCAATVAPGAWAGPPAAGGDPAEALLEEAVAERQPAETPHPAAEAMRLYHAGQYAHAIRWFDLALQADPDNETLITHRLIAREQTGQITQEEHEALQLIEQQRRLEVELAVRAVQLRTVRARTLLKRGRNAEALDLANDLMRLIDKLPEGIDRDVLLGPLHGIVDQAAGRRTPQQHRSRPRRYLPGQVRSVEEALARDAERIM
ncbi:MAG: hypothetical protein ACYSVY_11520, partial [Planctomycetota bacterium]